ncbi:MAG: alanine racemase [Parasphingorhabdus sp.]
MSDKQPDIPATAKVHLSREALIENWKTLSRLSGAASAGAAVKADAYGLGVSSVVEILQGSGCKDFFVANWQEASEIENIVSDDVNISVLNGIRAADLDFAVTSKAKPVLNSLQQAQLWGTTGKPCDAMIETGMNRLGIEVSDLDQIPVDGLNIDLVMSHLASADEDCEQNRQQLNIFLESSNQLGGKRRSLANSAGIALGSDYHFDCTRPGLSLYGGIQRTELAGKIKQVATPFAEIIQIRTLNAGDRVGYNAQYIANKTHDIAILAMGYADGYLRGFSNTGYFFAGDIKLPVLGKVSMDLIAIDISNAPQLETGDWVECEYDLPTASEQSGISQYELITGLGQRLPRVWT